MKINSKWWTLGNPFYNTGNEEFNIYTAKIKGSNYSVFDDALFNNVLSRGEDIDNSIAYAKVDEDCPWTNYTIVNKADNDSKRIFTNKSVPLVNYLMRGELMYVPGTDLGQSFNLSTDKRAAISLPYYKCASWYNSEAENQFPIFSFDDGRKYVQISPNTGGFSPVGKFGGKAYLLGIEVIASQTVNGDKKGFTLEKYCDTGYKTHPYIRCVQVVPYSYDTNGTRQIPSIGTYEYDAIKPAASFLPLTEDITLKRQGGEEIKLSTWDVYSTTKGRRCQNIFGCANGSATSNDSLSTNNIAYMVIDQKAKVVQIGNSGTYVSATKWDEIASTIAEVKEYFRKSVAYLGLFFTDGTVPTKRPTFTENSIMLGLMDGEGVTHGEYSKGTANKDQIQFNSKNLQEDSKVDPTQKDRPRPEQDRNPVLPSTPGFSLASAGSQTYVMTKENFQQVWDDIYERSSSSWKDLIEGLQLFGSNPLGAILSYRWFPFYLKATTLKNSVVLGNTVVHATHLYPIITNANSFYSMGGKFWYGKEKNFINSKYCKCRVWLPFYGFAELPMTQILAKELEIKFQYNAPDDIGVWIISFGNVIYDYYECSPYIEIPITGDNSRAISIAKQSQAINTALTVGAAVVGIGLSVAGAASSISAAAAASDVTFGEYMGSALRNTKGFFTGSTMDFTGPEALKQVGIVSKAVGGATAATVGGGVTAVKGITASSNQIGTLSTNVPTKAGAAGTTFLHLPMKPYIQFYTNDTMETMDLEQYRKTVGIACEEWGTIESMPENSLLVISNPTFNTSGMTQNEVNALISALNGFYK